MLKNSFDQKYKFVKPICKNIFMKSKFPEMVFLLKMAISLGFEGAHQILKHPTWSPDSAGHFDV